MIVEIAVNEIELGHYVVDIVEQDGTYQLRKPGHVKSEKSISNLASRGVKTLLIDTSKTLTVTQSEDDEKPSFSQAPSDKKPQEPLAFELSQAKAIFSHSKKVQHQVLQDIVADKEIDLGPIKDITDETVETVFKNPDALACILNIRMKDEYLLEHSVSVSVLVAIFSRHLNLDKRLAKEISVGAFLHDVGKIKIPDNILNKPSRLTDDEFEIMKTHVNHSIDIINQTPGLSDVSLEVAALHHEKLNGSGYPYQLAADDISLYGRMITICDIFDALTADRVYKKGYCHVKAFNILRKLASTNELDAELVDKFIQCMGVYPIGSLVELNTNKLAIVEARTDDPIRPKVRSFYNTDFRRYTMTQDIDLSKADDFIVKSVRADEFNLEMNKIVEFLMLQG
ncbi:HD-GYP domain-containing protein [Thalassotalea sp. M1531]|uniref:HD-GYP domain-containing protein n=1 Tax=Thalassotalea algicola TaxID=2716224 RepID=A0A7Y0LC70_9GAMM|nr:HD-GYP domain-containing protein [Thalassotalea algicola]NMP31905.1 HD-GYP domain-containing protein [Thalassotalea algicola]